MMDKEQQQRLLTGVMTRLDRGHLEDLVPDRPGDEVLVGYVSGALDAASVASLDAYFNQHPEEQARLRELREMIATPPSLSLVAAPEAAKKPERAPRRRRAGAVLLAGVLAAAGYGGGHWHGKFTSSLTQQTLIDIVEERGEPLRKSALAQLQKIQVQIRKLQIAIMNGDAPAIQGADDEEKLKSEVRAALSWHLVNVVEALSKDRKQFPRVDALLTRLQNKLSID